MEIYETQFQERTEPISLCRKCGAPLKKLEGKYVHENSFKCTGFDGHYWKRVTPEEGEKMMAEEKRVHEENALHVVKKESEGQCVFG